MQIGRLLTEIIAFLRDEQHREKTENHKKLLCKFRVQNRIQTQGLDEVIQQTMPHFYNDVYKLETTQDEEKDIPVFLDKYIGEINSQNSAQGKNGVFYGFGVMPHITIRSILLNNDCTINADLIDRAFVATSETLLSSKQTIKAKCDAVSLLAFLCTRYPETIKRNAETVEKLKTQRAIVQNSEEIDFFSQTQESELRFSSLLLYHCFGENVWLQMLEILPHFNDSIDSQIRVCKEICAYLETINTAPLDTNIEALFLQQALSWDASTNLDLRWNAIKLLFFLIRNPNNKGLISNQLIKTMDSDNAYIKSLIIGKIRETEAVDAATKEYILSKCKTDPHYVVRKKATE